MISHGSNPKLAAVLTEAQFSASGLARRINDLAVQDGQQAPKSDHTSVSRWLAGQCPRANTTRLLCRVFTQALGRPVASEDLGLGAPSRDADTALIYHHDLDAAFNAAAALYRSDVRRRSFLRTSATATACAVPVVRYLTAPETPPPSQEHGRRVGTPDVSAIHEVTATFRRLDNQLGGGYGRSTIVSYLADEAMPLLQHGAYSERTGTALCSAVGSLTLLAGWMAYDLELHSIAQRYLIQALRLAKAGGDDALGAEVLAGMSHQAAYLGQADDAIDMARAAGKCARKTGLGALAAEAHAVEAHGHALAGSSRSAAVSLLEAENALGTGECETPPWLDYFDEAYLAAQSARTLSAADQPGAAVSLARRSLDMQVGYARGRLLNLVLLAGAHAQNGDVDEAARTGAQALDAADGIQSARPRTRLKQLAGALSAHQTQPDVSEFRERVDLLPAI